MSSGNHDERTPIIKDDEIAKSYDSHRVDSFNSMNEPLKNDCSLTLSWNSLHASIDILSKKRRGFRMVNEITDTKSVLINISGYASPGQVLAIMGNSGSGKTSLMQVLSGRYSNLSTVSGSIYLNREHVDVKTLQRLCRYINENDPMIGYLTVKQHLMFQAMLQVDANNDQERHERITAVLQLTDLTMSQNRLIGFYERDNALSESERRRLTYASILLTNPSLIVIDDPISGLDAIQARSVMATIRSLANAGKTVIITLRQSSSYAFQMIDQMCLIAFGHLAFFGSRAEAQEFFSSMNRFCPIRRNPSEFYLEQLSIVHKQLYINQEGEIMVGDSNNPLLPWYDIVVNFRQSKFYHELENNPKLQHSSDNDNDEPFPIVRRFQANYFRQMKWLIWRSFLSNIRNPENFKILLLKSAIASIVIGILFFQLYNTPAIVQNVNSVSFVTLTVMSYINSFVIISKLPDELKLFFREHKQGSYKIFTYYISRVISELPFFIILPFLSTAIIYLLADMRGSIVDYLCYCSFVTLATNASVAFSSIIASLSKSKTNALALVSPFFETFVLLGGFFINNASIPIYFRWTQYLSWFYYAYALMLTFIWDQVDAIPCQLNTFCLPHGSDVLDYNHVRQNAIGFYLAMIFTLIVVYHSVVVLVLWIRVRFEMKNYRS